LSFVLQIIANVAVISLTVIQFAMLARAILSWLPIDSNRFTDFLYGLTEPLIYPIRKLFEKLNWFQETPIDVAFTVTYLLIMIVLLLL